jgi:hypothetical protein
MHIRDLRRAVSCRYLRGHLPPDFNFTHKLLKEKEHIDVDESLEHVNTCRELFLLNMSNDNDDQKLESMQPTSNFHLTPEDEVCWASGPWRVPLRLHTCQTRERVKSINQLWFGISSQSAHCQTPSSIRAMFQETRNMYLARCVCMPQIKSRPAVTKGTRGKFRTAQSNIQARTSYSVDARYRF